MNEMTKFKNNEFGNVRSIMIDNEIWFVGKDIADALGYTNSRKAIGDHVDEEDKGVTKCDTLGGVQDLVVINESGLYSLILSSKLPNAKIFKRWITHEVIPSIRKTGFYSVNNDIASIINITNSLLEQNKLIVEQNSKLLTLLNKSNDDYKSQIENSKYPVTIGLIANDYGLSAKKLNLMLANEGIQSKEKGYWRINDKYITNNYVITLTYSNKKGATNINTKWTKEGRLFIYDFLKSHGILPICEK